MEYWAAFPIRLCWSFIFNTAECRGQPQTPFLRQKSKSLMARLVHMFWSWLPECSLLLSFRRRDCWGQGCLLSSCCVRERGEFSLQFFVWRHPGHLIFQDSDTVKPFQPNGFRHIFPGPIARNGLMSWFARRRKAQRLFPVKEETREKKKYSFCQWL